MLTPIKQRRSSLIGVCPLSCGQNVDRMWTGRAVALAAPGVRARVGMRAIDLRVMSQMGRCGIVTASPRKTRSEAVAGMGGRLALVGPVGWRERGPWFRWWRR